VSFVFVMQGRVYHDGEGMASTLGTSERLLRYNVPVLNLNISLAQIFEESQQNLGD